MPRSDAAAIVNAAAVQVDHVTTAMEREAARDRQLARAGTTAVAAAPSHAAADERAALEAEIAQLRREIAGMERVLLDQDDAAERDRQSNIEAVMQQLLRSSNHQLQRELTAEISAAAQRRDTGHDGSGEAGSASVLGLGQLKALATFTGITFQQASSVVEPDTEPNKWCRTYSLRGTCHDLSFDLTFRVLEPDMVISDLAVDVPEEARIELRDFLDSVEKERSLQAFFHGFVQYAEWNAQRQVLFYAMYERYPAQITLPHGVRCGPVLNIKPFPAFKFAVSLIWIMTVLPSGHVRCTIHLRARKTDELTKADKVSLDALPDEFQQLIRARGLQSAVEQVIEVLCGPA
ncbi:hypothetical protein CAOG_04529 [Capsaspora owczarzaki ATCC 30864]|uniref:Centromere protein P n=1 Tax=Capsaspora owczarzaki (strain ATCC 30864) TaxID=595528 RepID=A0A0D2WQ95_CAPO3|nr:hypothetical protein CAOG_04529 [Capsaspora owczarzaki ATCC 30864]KJE93785.1 hypothetical protein CAOG_004529 [Capsaspora owczarzaki ATCC 30864]|eukprot:XP_004347276.2 hypothetical protein CAOG_04529 [Capsaspora owczarzaki ATCC 30864]